MRVPLSHGEGGVSKQFFHGVQINARLYEPGCVGVSQRMYHHVATAAHLLPYTDPLLLDSRHLHVEDRCRWGLIPTDVRQDCADTLGHGD